MLLAAFPDDPEISGEDLIAGVQQTLTCTARNLYPADIVSVEWKQGNISVVDDNPQIIEDASGKSSISSNYTMIPSGMDNGGNITCRVIQTIQIGFDRKQNSRTRSVQLTVNLGK